MSRCKWNFSTLDELHKTANVTLKFAMINERSKRWGKVRTVIVNFICAFESCEVYARYMRVVLDLRCWFDGHVTILLACLYGYVYFDIMDKVS